MTKPINLEQTHAGAISEEKFLYEIADVCVAQGITAKRAICDRIAEEMKKEDFVVYLSGSSFTGASANPLHFAVSKFVKVFYGSNERLVIGSAYHEAIDFCYQHMLDNKGKTPRLGLAVRKIVEYVNTHYSEMTDESKEKFSEADVVKLAVIYFKVYYKSVMPHNTPVESEVFVSFPVPDGLLTRPELNGGKIYLTGAADQIFKTDKGLVLSDCKTAKNPISGKVDADPKLSEYQGEVKALGKELVALNKQIAKFAHAEEKVQEFKTTLADLEAKLADAIENGKATKAIENKVAKQESEIVKWSEHHETYITNVEAAHEKSLEIEELEELIKPLQAIYDEEKAKADLQEAKKMHGQQLAFYSLLYMIIYGKQIDRVRVEVLVKAKEPYVQTFEWSLDERVKNAADEEIRANISLIEMAMNGTDPLVLFRANKFSFIGDETNKFLEKCEDIIRESESEAGNS